MNTFLIQMRSSIRSALQSLPAPRNDYEIVVPQWEDEPAPTPAPAAAPDQADVDAAAREKQRQQCMNYRYL